MSSSTIELMSPMRVERTLKRMTLEIIEKHAGKGNIFIFGINDRGYKLAKKIASIIKAVTRINRSPIRVDVQNGTLSDSTVDLNNSFVIVVDDVIFSGESFKKALDLIEPLGKPRTIKIAVLVDRGHRKFPIEPEFAGMVHPTKLNEHVEVYLPDSDGLDRVVLFEQAPV
jgi:pyrimidine operon attenuation protein / uracil phosphoribosyltransferase